MLRVSGNNINSVTSLFTSCFRRLSGTTSFDTTSICGAAPSSGPSPSSSFLFSATGAAAGIGATGAAAALPTSSICLSMAAFTTACIEDDEDDDDGFEGGAPVGRGGLRRNLPAAEAAFRKRCRAAVPPPPPPPFDVPPSPPFDVPLPLKLPNALFPPLPIHRRDEDDEGALPGRRFFGAATAGATSGDGVDTSLPFPAGDSSVTGDDETGGAGDALFLVVLARVVSTGEVAAAVALLAPLVAGA